MFTAYTLIAASLLAALCLATKPLNYTVFDTGLYLAVIYPAEDGNLQKAANRSLSSLSLPFQLTPLYSPFAATASFPVILEGLCRKWEGRTIVAALVVSGDDTLVLASALATGGAGVPMVWVSESAYAQEPLGEHVIRLGPSEKGLVKALRSFLISSKWYSSHLLYSGPPSGLDNEEVKWLTAAPLNPTIHRLNPSSSNMRALKNLAHLPRGVAVVIGDVKAAASILDQATQMGLTSSGFVWIWADTSEAVRRTEKHVQRVRRDEHRLPIRLPVGLLAIRAVSPVLDRHLVRSALKLLVEAMKRSAPTVTRSLWKSSTTCSSPGANPMANFTKRLIKELRIVADQTQSGRSSSWNETTSLRPLSTRYRVLNLVPEPVEAFTQDEKEALPPVAFQISNNWKQVGEIIGCCDVKLERIIWPGGTIGGPCGGVRSKIKVVTAVAAPFVMTSDIAREAANEKSCLRGVPCSIVSDYNGTRYTYKVSCCYGLSMDLLEAVSQELDMDYSVYLAPDSMFGSRVVDPDSGIVKWNGVVGDLIRGHADMAFTALSVSRPRSEVIDFSGPYYFSGVSFLAAPATQTDIPLLAFLLPFSTELWIAIFTSLNVTAIAVAIYEWFSPFGLNPWGRQRTKNFSMSSALWVCWGLLCGHLVAFKAPKSWPNKFLINVWGGFSVIFVASYTANIAALIAGLFFHSATATYHDNSLLWQKVGAPKGSASDYYVHRANQMLWEHMQRFPVPDVETGVQYLKNGTLDILIADTPILDYYRATDQGCKLQKIGDAINEDTYAVGMTKGFPLKDSVSAVIAKFTSNGYMDLLQEKWYGGLACFSLDMDMSQPKPLGVTAVAGVFMLLGLGVAVGLLILLVEHLFYRYTLPILRHKPKGTIWRSRNVMFFSQKLYRFINCVDLVSPHHAARELVHTLRQGQITSLFQKSVRRMDLFQKEHEQRGGRRSKAQFFEMIQEIRRVQQEEKQNSATDDETSDSVRLRSPTMYKEKSLTLGKVRPPSRLEMARRFSKDVFRSKSSGNLDDSSSSRRYSSDINFAANRFLEAHSSQAIGRRLSRDTNLSPPDINSRRASHLQLTPELSVASSDGIELGGSAQNTPKSPFLTLPHARPCQQSTFFSGNSGVSGLGKQLSLQEKPTTEHVPVVKQISLQEKPPRCPPRQSSLLPPDQRAALQQELLQAQSSAPEISVHPPATPRRVTSLSSAPKRFSYVDASSPGFKERLSRYADDETRRGGPSLLEQISTMQEQFQVKPKVVSCLAKQQHNEATTLQMLERQQKLQKQLQREESRYNRDFDLK